MPTNITDDQINTLSEMIFQGQKIQAIKLYREMSNLGLKESKDAVEELEKSLRSTAPGKFTAGAQGKGCLGIIVAGLMVSGVVTYCLTQN